VKGKRVENRDSGTTRLLYVGRLERDKGLYLLLEAMRPIPNTSSRNVSFEGFWGDSGRFYEEADIFVMPSSSRLSSRTRRLESLQKSL
jgi:hypothetical protein